MVGGLSGCGICNIDVVVIGNQLMNVTNKTGSVIAFGIVVVLFLLFGAGAMTGTTMTGGMMGTGNMGGISWMWLPTFLVVVLGAVLFSVIFGKK